jgi:NADH-quinone oxidoreductase subunit H
MVSYEIAMGMSLIPVLLLAGNVTLNEIVDQQATMHIWNVLTLTISFFIFTVAAFAETKPPAVRPSRSESGSSPGITPNTAR